MIFVLILHFYPTKNRILLAGFNAIYYDLF